MRNSFFARNWRQNTLRNCRFAWKVKLEENTVRIFPVARNWGQNTLRNCRFGWKVKLEENTVRIFPVA